jgi:hypothetical protein
VRSWHGACATCNGLRGSLGRVPVTPRHRDVEAHFRALLESADLPVPDDVGYEPDAVVFYWHEPKLAVFVDFESGGEGGGG